MPSGLASTNSLDHIFHYRAVNYHDLNDLPQWLRVLRRHPREDIRSDQGISRWQSFLNSIKNLPAREQIRRVNRYANKKRYIQDIDNYGQEDYWAIVKEFIQYNGDCEDFAITKFFSLRALGFPPDRLRIVILQDTNLGVAHAVLAVALNNSILIMDNQTEEVLSDREIVHYTPLYSVNEKQWWLHLPPM